MDQTQNSIFSENYRPSTRAKLLNPVISDNKTSDTPTRKRRFDVMYLDRAGQFCEQSLLAARHPAFEQAFSVLKQGALVQSDRGHLSIEQVYPGDRLRLSDGSYELVQWRGAITVNPDDTAANTPGASLTRIVPDAMGDNRPATDVVLGHGARILYRAPGIKRVSGNDVAFIPAADFIDGNTMLELRPSMPFTLYQLGFHGQRSLDVNGVAVETLHPGTAFNLGLRGDSLRSFLALFPHKSSFEDFGLLHVPRLRLGDLDLLG